MQGSLHNRAGSCAHAQVADCDALGPWRRDLVGAWVFVFLLILFLTYSCHPRVEVFKLTSAQKMSLELAGSESLLYKTVFSVQLFILTFSVLKIKGGEHL